MRYLVVVLMLVLVGCAKPPPAYESKYTPPTTTPPVAASPQASWVDTFDRPDGGMGDGWQMLEHLYQPRVPATDGYIRAGKYTYDGTQVVYAVKELRGPVQAVGTSGSWRRLRDGADTAVALVICGNDNLVTDMLHLVVQRDQWALTVRRDNGAFTPVANGVFQPPLLLDTPYRMELSATEGSATVRLPNGRVIHKNVPTNGLLGDHAFWEEYVKPDQFPAGSVFDFDTAWAEEGGQPVQPIPGP